MTDSQPQLPPCPECGGRCHSTLSGHQCDDCSHAVVLPELRLPACNDPHTEHTPGCKFCEWLAARRSGLSPAEALQPSGGRVVGSAEGVPVFGNLTDEQREGGIRMAKEARSELKLSESECSCQRAQTWNPALHCPVHGQQDDFVARCPHEVDGEIELSCAPCAVEAERARMVKWFDANGIPGPITNSKGIPCEHGIYSWHNCEPCAVSQILDATYPEGELQEGGST